MIKSRGADIDVFNILSAHRLSCLKHLYRCDDRTRESLNQPRLYFTTNRTRKSFASNSMEVVVLAQVLHLTRFSQPTDDTEEKANIASSVARTVIGDYS